MYEAFNKLYKTYNAKIVKPNVVVRNNLDMPVNSKLKNYASESLKKSIKKIEDQYKDPNYKFKLIAAKAFNDDKSNNKKNNKNNNNTIEIIIGATTISFSLYLVYSFMKRYRT